MQILYLLFRYNKCDTCYWNENKTQKIYKVKTFLIFLLNYDLQYQVR